MTLYLNKIGVVAKIMKYLLKILTYCLKILRNFLNILTYLKITSNLLKT